MIPNRSKSTAANSRIALKKPQKIQQVLGQAFKRFGLDKEIARYQFVLHWPEIVGAEIAKKTKPECIRNGALVVRVIDSTWAQELSFQKDVILHRLRKYVEAQEIINDVMFYVGTLD